MTKPCWKVDKRWSDKFIPLIKPILGAHLIGEPPAVEDEQRNTDLIVLRMEAVRIACRIRKHSYMEKYGYEFTVRCERPGGAKTELDKIIEGWGDYFFYGFASRDEQSLAQWILGDLRPFRLWVSTYMRQHGGLLPGKRMPNGDNSSMFRAFDRKDLPVEFFVATSPLSDETLAAEWSKVLV